jgi:streptomycin 6-kinase
MNIFEQNIINIYGDEGRNWLKNLPGIVNNLASQYDISNLSPVTNLTYNYVLEGLQGTQPIILKCALERSSRSKRVLGCR